MVVQICTTCEFLFKIASAIPEVPMFLSQIGLSSEIVAMDLLVCCQLQNEVMLMYLFVVAVSF